jgi:hypothetical protein
VGWGKRRSFGANDGHLQRLAPIGELYLMLQDIPAIIRMYTYIDSATALRGFAACSTTAGRTQPGLVWSDFVGSNRACATSKLRIARSHKLHDYCVHRMTQLAQAARKCCVLGPGRRPVIFRSQPVLSDGRPRVAVFM